MTSGVELARRWMVGSERVIMLACSAGGEIGASRAPLEGACGTVSVMPESTDEQSVLLNATPPLVAFPLRTVPTHERGGS
jgi:hypothetical protein